MRKNAFRSIFFLFKLKLTKEYHSFFKASIMGRIKMFSCCSLGCEASGSGHRSNKIFFLSSRFPGSSVVELILLCRWERSTG